LPDEITNALDQNKEVVVSAVLSGNRNFEGRVHPQVQANYLASPPLVVAYALAGTVDIDLLNEPIGYDKSGNPVMLSEIWPTQREILETIQRSINPAMFHKHYEQVFDGNPTWNAIPETSSQVYEWDEKSTYVQEPPFFLDITVDLPPVRPIQGARVLGLFKDSITTDHISPAGSIHKSSAAGKYLLEHGVELRDFNTYGTRRGNDRIMTRGTFANTRLKNELIPGKEGSITLYLPTGEQMSIYDAAMRYKEDNTPLVILAGGDYGMGSSRDWAAKGTMLLGVRAVIAKSFERIHRSNLVFMGILPLVFKSGEGWQELGLNGHEVFTLDLPETLVPGQDIIVHYTRPDGTAGSFVTTMRVDTPIEIEYYRNGGILHTVLRNLLKENAQPA
jgi:aconitate hydratase